MAIVQSISPRDRMHKGDKLTMVLFGPISSYPVITVRQTAPSGIFRKVEAQVPV